MAHFGMGLVGLGCGAVGEVFGTVFGVRAVHFCADLAVGQCLVPGSAG